MARNASPKVKITTPEIDISPMTEIMSGSRHFVPVTRNSCLSSVYDILLKYENLAVIVTGRKRILSVTHEPAVISCTEYASVLSHNDSFCLPICCINITTPKAELINV